jgi:integration host factor subunit beta
MFDAMANSLMRGERIEIRGFGSFAVKQRRARQGRNPKTGQLVKVDAKQIPFFRAGKELRIEVNGADESGR